MRGFGQSCGIQRRPYGDGGTAMSGEFVRPTAYGAHSKNTSMPRNCRLTLRMLAACTLGGDIDMESSRAMRDAGISPAVRERLSCQAW